METTTGKKTGHAITTYRMRLYDRHFPWLVQTGDLYTGTVKHFLEVLLLEKELLQQSDFLLLRALEACCIGTKEMKAAGEVPKYPLHGFPKIPLYFRRSAINSAIALARKWDRMPDLQERETLLQTIENVPIILYKGMYQEFKENSIDLKLFNGEKWQWVTYPYKGRKIPEEAETLSPTLVLEKKTAWLHVPVSTVVQDIRTVKERMKETDRFCAVSFPDNDVLAVAVILDKDGKKLDCRYFRGGRQKAHQREQVLSRIARSKKSRGNGKKEKENLHLYEELREINQYYSHSISKQILSYCKEQEICVIAVPNYEAALDFSDKKFLTTDSYRWLGRSMIRNLKYKAFSEGIVVTSVRPYHVADRCSDCEEIIRRYNEGHVAGKNYYGGKLFVCPKGHRGNAAENAAINIGKLFLSFY